MRENIQNQIYERIATFAKNLKMERNSRGLTQKNVAEMLGIKTQSYQAYESGIAMPSAENLLKIAIVFQLSLDELFEL